MNDNVIQGVLKDPAYQELKSRRTRFGMILTLLMLLVYYGFVFLVAFNKDLLATRIGTGVSTLGIPLGMGVIVITIVLTAIYVRRANGEYDRLNDEIVQRAGR